MATLSWYNSCMSKQNVLLREFDRLRQYRMLLAIGVAIILFSGWMLLTNNKTNPTDVFWGMFDTSLSTTSVTRNVKDANEKSKADQSLRLYLSPELKTYNIVTVEETTDKGNTKIVTETIGTPKSDYARYTTIETAQQGADGKPIDFSNVTGIWGKNDLAEGKSGYFNEGMLGLVPFADIDQGKREGLISFMKDKNVYETDLNAAVKQKVDNHTAYIYKIKINPTAYIQMLIEFAKQSGLGELPGLDPEQYAKSQPLETEFIIDANTQQLIKINYIANKREETYIDYGLQQPLELPTDTIPLDELQSRLQKLQQ